MPYPFPRPLLFLDLETTGLESATDSIIEIAALQVAPDGTELSRIDQLLTPTRTPLTPFITSITGITPTELQANGIDPTEVLPELQKMIHESLIVGHNIGFDIAFLRAYGVEISPHQWMDTHALARIVLPGEASYSQESLSSSYGLQIGDAHRAMSDILTNRALLDFLLRQSLPHGFRPALEAAPEHFPLVQLLRSLPTAPPLPAPVVEVENAPVNPPSPVTPLQAPGLYRIAPCSTGVEEITPLLQAVAAQEPVIFITPRHTLFPEVKPMPTPYVLFDPSRLTQSLPLGGITDEDTLHFTLQCWHRHALGHRGKHHFDLHHHMHDLWREHAAATEKSPIWQQILTERAGERLLSITPEAWVAWRKLPLLTDRRIAVDEIELTALRILQATGEDIRLPESHQLSAEDAQATTYLSTYLVRDEVPRLLGQKPSRFQNQMILPEGEHFSTYRPLLEGTTDPTLQRILQWMDGQVTGLRTLTYDGYYESLTFSTVDPSAWRAIMQQLCTPTGYGFHRSSIASTGFFTKVLQCQTMPERPPLAASQPLPAITRPQRITDNANPRFPRQVLQLLERTLHHHQSPQHWVAVQVSSQAKLKEYGTLLKNNAPADWADHTVVLVERVYGGDGKLLAAMESAQTEGKRVILLTQKLLDPLLSTLPFRTLLIERFPFPPPDTVLDFLGEQVNASGGTWWHDWTEPQVGALLARRLSVYPQLEQLYWLDTRESSAWGKTVLQHAFGEGIFTRGRRLPEEDLGL